MGVRDVCAAGLCWGLGLVLAGCSTGASPPAATTLDTSGIGAHAAPRAGRTASKPPRVVTLAFAGDVHFQLNAAAVLDAPDGIGPVSRALATADLAMVNLESAVTERGSLDPKQLEEPASRFWFRAPARALDVLADAGVDVVTVANNHGADYGPVGLHDTLRAAAHAPLAVVGAGRDRAAAFTPHRVVVRGTSVAFLAGDASPLESTSSTWAAGRRTPGLAAAHGTHPRTLLRAVRSASRTSDVVVVYLHWGRAEQACPTVAQRSLAEDLAEAGADVVVGSHAHVLLGSGWLEDTYVDYGLGNFVWYHDGHPDTGVLRLRLEDGHVVSDAWVPGRLHRWGRPYPVDGVERAAAIARWRALRRCAALGPGPRDQRPPAYAASVHPLPADLAAALTSRRHCPSRPEDLRLLRLGYVDFDGRSRTGELVVAARFAHDVTQVFRRLYAARWPIRRMRPAEAYGGDDDRSMAADNTSGFNCRRVAGSTHWSAHAFGAAIDLDPVRNPYVTPDGVRPPAGGPYAALDRSASAVVPRGVIRSGDVVVRAFASIGWTWGGDWSTPDFQHFYADSTRRP